MSRESASFLLWISLAIYGYFNWMALLPDARGVDRQLASELWGYVFPVIYGGGVVVWQHFAMPFRWSGVVLFLIGLGILMLYSLFLMVLLLFVPMY